METNNSAIVKIQIPATELELELVFPKNTYLAKNTLTSIHNAWTASAAIDQHGSVWVAASRMHTILRTTKSNARYYLEYEVGSEHKKTIDGETYIAGTEIGCLLDNIIQNAGSISREEYTRFSEDYYGRIRNSKEAKIIRAERYERMSTYRGELKRIRIAQMSINYDELTNDSLQQSQFSHIRSFAIHYQLADKIWNGLVVNRTTHKIITSAEINDEDQLLQLCRKYNWNTNWYDTFIINLKEYHSN